jgi:hypothetical protein
MSNQRRSTQRPMPLCTRLCPAPSVAGAAGRFSPSAPLRRSARIEQRVAIAVGNLSYHFPTKDSLLELLINQTLKEYASRFATLPAINWTGCDSYELVAFTGVSRIAGDS